MRDILKSAFDEVLNKLGIAALMRALIQSLIELLGLPGCEELLKMAFKQVGLDKFLKYVVIPLAKLNNYAQGMVNFSQSNFNRAASKRNETIADMKIVYIEAKRDAKFLMESLGQVYEDPDDWTDEEYNTRKREWAFAGGRVAGETFGGGDEGSGAPWDYVFRDGTSLGGRMLQGLIAGLPFTDDDIDYGGLDSIRKEIVKMENGAAAADQMDQNLDNIDEFMASLSEWIPYDPNSPLDVYEQLCEAAEDFLEKMISMAKDPDQELPELPKPPVLKLPDQFPINDMLEKIPEEIQKQVETMLMQMLITTLQTIIKILIEICRGVLAGVKLSLINI